MSRIAYRILSIRNNPAYAERAVDWFASKWGIDRREYEKSMDDRIHKGESLPQWYIAVDERDEIIGGYGLIQNDFIDRTDLFPYLCALFVEERMRGSAIGAELLKNARTHAGRLGLALRSCIFAPTTPRIMKSTDGCILPSGIILGARHRGYTKLRRLSNGKTKRL